MIKKIKENLILFSLFLTGFILSFFKGTKIQVGEDLTSSVATFKFWETFSLNPIMADQLNAMEFFALPFYIIFGFQHSSLRLAQAFLLGLSISLFYLFMKKVTEDRFISIFSALILSLSPYYILMKFGEYPAVGFLSTLILLLSVLVMNKGRKAYLILLGIVSGLSFYYKIVMGPYVFCLLASFLIFDFNRARKGLWNVKDMTIFVAFVGLGALPLISFNALVHPATLEVAIDGLGSTSGSLIDGVITRLIHFREIFTANPPKYYGVNSVIGDGVVVAFIFSVSYFIFTNRKRFLVYPLTAFLYFLFSTIQLNPVEPLHLYPLIPLAVATIGLFVYSLTIDFKKERQLIYAGFLLIAFFSLFNIVSVFATKNSYNFYLSDYHIGHALRGHNFDNIYLFQPQNYAFYNSLLFTTQHKDVFSSHELLSGGNNIGHGYWAGGEVGEFKGYKIIEANFDDVLEEATSKNNVYIDTELFYEPESEMRVESRKKMDSFLIGNGYKRVDITTNVIRTDQKRKYRKTHFVWIREDRQEVIEELRDDFSPDKLLTF